MTKERLTYVDTAKFLAIWMVIVSHSPGSDISRFFFGFHVPLFFILYGFVFKEKKEKVTFKDSLKIRFTSLWGRVLVPYFLLAFILGKGLSIITLPYVLWGSLQSLVGVSSTHLWFLPCYCVAVLLFGLLFDIMPKTKYSKVLSRGIILILTVISALLNSERDLSLTLGGYQFFFTGLGVTTTKAFYIGFPFAINVAFTGMSFIYAGYLIRKLFEMISSNKLILIVIGVVCASLGTFLFFQNNGNERLIAMSYAQYGNYLLFVSTAILLSVSAIVLSLFIDNRIFSKYGQYTMSIYGFHLVLIFVGHKITIFMNCPDANINAILIGTITLVISCAIIPVIRFIDPYILGERKK